MSRGRPRRIDAAFVRAELGANRRTNRALTDVGGMLLEAIDLPSNIAVFRWRPMASHRGLTHIATRPVIVELADHLTPEQATDTLLHELAHVIAAVAGDRGGIDTQTGHHGDVFQIATQLVSETFGITATEGPLNWPGLRWAAPLTLVADGWR